MNLGSNYTVFILLLLLFSISNQQSVALVDVLTQFIDTSLNVVPGALSVA